MFWKDLNITINKYSKYIIFIIILLSMMYSTFDRNSKKNETANDKYNVPNIVISVLNSDEKAETLVNEYSSMYKVVKVDSIEAGKKFNNNSDVFFYTVNNDVSAYLNPASKNLDYTVLLLDSVFNKNSFELKQYSENNEQDSQNTHKNKANGIDMAFIILSVSLMILSYNMIKDDENVKNQIIYSPENNKIYVLSKTLLIFFVCILLAIYTTFIYELSPFICIFICLLLLFYCFLGFIFAILSKSTLMTICFWGIFIGLTVGQMFLMRAFDVTNAVCDIKVTTNLYIFIAVGVLTIMCFYYFTQFLWKHVNEIERK